MKEYTLVIASNFLDHYQLSLSNELRKYFNDFYFVVSEKLEDEYKKLGFSELNDNEFVIKAYEDKEKAREIILNADIVLTGSYLYKEHIYKRQKLKKPIIFYSERLFKYNKLLNYVSAIINICRHRMSNESSLLCVSAFTAGDYNKINLFKDRTYKWGYFPKTIKYSNIKELIESKRKKSIFWAGRFIEWKHPDDAIEIANRLKKEGIKFTLNIAGTGKMESELKELVNKYSLNDCVHFLGSMPPEKIREYMELSEIYLFTSDKGEGWGVVLNEAMNSACACIASYSAGSTPFLINNGKNGYYYQNQNIDDLYIKTKNLLQNDDNSEIMENAYNTIANEWSTQVAAERLYNYSVSIIEGKKFVPYESGIMSKGELFHE